ncbi:MAG: hypothetical protein U0992_00470 [Planctomycetaceae bacterium]
MSLELQQLLKDDPELAARLMLPGRVFSGKRHVSPGRAACSSATALRPDHAAGQPAGTPGRRRRGDVLAVVATS